MGISSISQRLDIHELALNPSLNKVQVALKQLSFNKVPYKHGILPEIFQYGGQKLNPMLLWLFLEMWKVKHVPIYLRTKVKYII